MSSPTSAAKTVITRWIRSWHFTFVMLTFVIVFAAPRASVSAEPSSDARVSPVFSPYVDMTLWPTFDLVTTTKDHAIKHYTLAFVTSNDGKPCWGGFSAYRIDDQGEFHKKLKRQIEELRKLGGDVTVSFGGATGTELATAHKDVRALVKAYQSVVDAYDLRRIDFDIEGAAITDRKSNVRRAKAIAALQAAATKREKPLDVWLTLPVLPSGLTADGTNVVSAAVEHGVRLSGVNIMAMNYGDGAAPKPKGRMGDYAIQAATGVHRQLGKIYAGKRNDTQLWRMIGVTPMIGLNNVTTEVFDLSDAKKLHTFAQRKNLGMLSLWSLNRDRPHANGKLDYVSPKFSSIRQRPFEFSQILGNRQANR